MRLNWEQIETSASFSPGNLKELSKYVSSRVQKDLNNVFPLCAIKHKSFQCELYAHQIVPKNVIRKKL